MNNESLVLAAVKHHCEVDFASDVKWVADSCGLTFDDVKSSIKALAEKGLVIVNDELSVFADIFYAVEGNALSFNELLAA